MLEQIQEVVRKNLPAEVGEQLKKFMEEASSFKDRCARFEKQIEADKQSLKLKDEEIKELTAKLKLAGDLHARETHVSKQENNLTATMATERADAAERRSGDIMQLVSLVFRNPRMVRVYEDSETVPVTTQGTSYPMPFTKTKTIKETEEINPDNK